MGTKIQANPYLREFQSSISLDATTSNAMTELSSNDMERVRHTILEHESTFRNQLRELHRLHGRQQELMNKIRRRGINKDDVMEEKLQFQLSHLLSPFPTGNANRPLNCCHSFSTHSMFGCLPLSGGSYSLGFPADSSFSNTEKKQMQERFSKFPLVESISEKRNLQTSSNLNLVTKDFLHDSLDRMNKEGHLSTLGSRNERSRNEHPSDDYAEKRRNDRHSSVGGLFSGKALAFPQPPLSEPRNEFSNRPLDIGTSLCRKKKKIFGVEISEGNDATFDLASNMSNLDRGASFHKENHPAPTLDSSSLGADTFAQSLKLRVADWNDGNNERSKADETSSQKRLSSCHSGMNEKWFEGDFMTHFKNMDSTNTAADVLKKDQEHSQSNHRNPIGSLPWFLRNPRVSAGLNNGAKSCYFMNLDSLQNCSQKFFANSMHKKEVEVDENGSRNHLGTNNCMSELRHCIDLNLSLDEDDGSSAPSLPSAVVKIATTEIDLEAPASPHQECDRTAAEAMIALSLSVEKELLDEFNSLKWFAEVISSEGGAYVSMDHGEAYDEEGSIPDGMDHFEFMTLRLEDTKPEHHCPEPFVSKTLTDDEAGGGLTRRTRRGQGRLRRDFQRDILPGLVTLSRLEVTEDFQAFEELSHRGSARNGRGRKRLGGATTASAGMKAPCSAEAAQPVEGRSLTGWGRKTRRLPRQRCPNAFLSFPVKSAAILPALND